MTYVVGGVFKPHAQHAQFASCLITRLLQDSVGACASSYLLLAVSTAGVGLSLLFVTLPCLQQFPLVLCSLPDASFVRLCVHNTHFAACFFLGALRAPRSTRATLTGP